MMIRARRRARQSRGFRPSTSHKKGFRQPKQIGATRERRHCASRICQREALNAATGFAPCVLNGPSLGGWIPVGPTVWSHWNASGKTAYHDLRGPQIRDGFVDVDQGVLDSIRDITTEFRTVPGVVVVKTTAEAKLVLLVL